MHIDDAKRNRRQIHNDNLKKWWGKKGISDQTIIHAHIHQCQMKIKKIGQLAYRIERNGRRRSLRRQKLSAMKVQRLEEEDIQL